MSPRKQSFLERLTGMQTVDEDERLPARASKPSRRFPGRIERPEPRYQTEEPEDERYEEPEAAVETPEEETPEEDTGDEPGIAVDMYESDNELVIQGMIAGVTPENLHISITRDTVTIHGKRIPPQGIPEQSYVNRELYWGPFTREIELPFEIDTEGAEAVEKYGLLIIRLPRLDTRRSAELKVRSV
jgi:HSP20 family protein